MVSSSATAGATSSAGMVGGLGTKGSSRAAGRGRDGRGVRGRRSYQRRRNLWRSRASHGRGAPAGPRYPSLDGRVPRRRADAHRRGARLAKLRTPDPLDRRGANLVEECQRARFALQREGQELAHRDLDLALGLGSDAERRQRLDVEALIRLQELERLERQAGALEGWARAPFAEHAAEGRHPAVALVRLEQAPALDTTVDL